MVITLVSHIPYSPSSPCVDADLMKNSEYIIMLLHYHCFIYTLDVFGSHSRWIFNVVHGVIVGYGLATLASKPKMRFAIIFVSNISFCQL